MRWHSLPVRRRNVPPSWSIRRSGQAGDCRVKRNVPMKRATIHTHGDFLPRSGDILDKPVRGWRMRITAQTTLHERDTRARIEGILYCESVYRVSEWWCPPHELPPVMSILHRREFAT